MLELNQVHEGDCLELMKEIPDGSVDMVLCDPPYGTSACNWDTIIPFEPMWEQLKRIVKPNGAIVLFWSEPFSSALRMSNIKMYKYDWVWNKTRWANFLNANFQPFKIHEFVHVFSSSASSFSKKGTMKYNPQFSVWKPYSQISGEQNEETRSSVRSKIYKVKTDNPWIRHPKSIIDFSLENAWQHPTQKPVALCEYLIKTYSNEGDTVLDFTCGSGSTGVAAKNLKRNFILIEKEPKYVEIARKRIW